MQSKVELRNYIYDKRRVIDKQYLLESSLTISNKVLQDESFIKSDTVFIYLSTPLEISTQYLVRQCYELGKRVCVPRCIGAGIMDACEIYGLQDLVINKMGILEPINNSSRVNDIDISIIPCLMSSKDCYRLGYGGGYYDRFLANSNSHKIILCLEENVVERIPISATDFQCDKVITEVRMYINEK